MREGHLVGYDAVTIRSGVRMNGIFLNEGEQVRMIDPETGSEDMDQLEDERKFDTADIERKITSPDSNRRIIEELRRYCEEHEAKYGRFPKTLIFAANDIHHVSHADQIIRLCREVFGQGDSFVQKITGSGTVDRPLQRIREFRNRPDPKVVVTVDMLSTGVDIPALEFIVFLRPVKSRILFEQMLGRGTRKCADLVPAKSHFTVFDCFDGTLLRYFRPASSMLDQEEPPEKPHRPLAGVIEDIWQNRDRAYNIRALVKRLQRVNKEMSGEARDDFAAFIPDGDLGKFATDLPQVLAARFTDTMKLLRNKQLQDLLVNYKRPKKVFLVADSVTDEVTSEWLIRGADGKEYRPADYLAEFSRFVKENPDHIEAIRILLDRPKAWSTEALSELRTKLRTTPLRFDEATLQKAHKLRYHKALADIISMVKHAAREAEPLLTAEERVDRALRTVVGSRTFTASQQKWIDRIRQHLVVNLTVGRDDFDYLPVFADFGGWGKADRDFDRQLMPLIKQINAAVAA